MNDGPTRKHLKDLGDDIRKDLDLLKSYKDELRYETDPSLIGKYRRRIEQLRELLAQDQQEYAELQKQATPEEVQNVTDLLQQQDMKLDEIRKLLPSVPTTGEEIFNIFLSHSHLDAVWVEELAMQLVDRGGLRVWLDKWVTEPDEPWRQAIACGHDNAKACAVCIGEQTPKGWFQEEIGRALDHRTKDTSFRVILVLLPNAQMINVDDFSELRTWVDFKNGIDDNQEFDRLVSWIRGVTLSRGPHEKIASESLRSIAREGLIKLRRYHSEGLIDKVILREYQRKLLDRYLLKG